MQFNQPYYGYQGQPMNMNYNTYTPVQQYIPQQFTQNQQPVSQVQNNMIPCEYVDNLDVVNAKNCDFSGRPMLYMKTDGSEIYRKQLDIKTGKSSVYLYKLQEESNENMNDYSLDLNELNSKIESLKTEFTQNINELKQMMIDISSSNSTQETTTPISRKGR